MEGGQYVNASEASEFLGISRPTFYKRHKKHLKRTRFGRKGIWYYAIADLEAIRDSIEEESAA